jgi:methylated-DNA-[protein]-cysteine S-methyltransferase
MNRTPEPSPAPSSSAAVAEELLPLEDSALADLHACLAARAEQDGLLEVAYRTVDSPVGPLLLAATPQGLVRIAYEREGFDAVLESLAARIGPRVLAAPRPLDAAATELEEYFAGNRRAFDLPLDHALSSGFRAVVQQALPQIDYGRTRTYKEVAELVGNPRAVRAVGTACATNPLPLVVPCHRVLRSDGSLGGYLGGAEAKTLLLALEQHGTATA